MSEPSTRSQRYAQFIRSEAGAEKMMVAVRRSGRRPPAPAGRGGKKKICGREKISEALGVEKEEL